jgi:hypothetical protein
MYTLLVLYTSLPYNSHTATSNARDTLRLMPMRNRAKEEEKNEVKIPGEYRLSRN